MPSRKLTRYIAAGVAAVAIGGGSYGIVTATSSNASTSTSISGSGAAGHTSGGGSNARSGPAAGGAAGTVSRVSGSGFTMSTSAGQQVTVDETSTTTYEKGTSPVSVSAVTAGQAVLVLGTTSSTTITATQVIVEPSGSPYTASSAQVVPFKRGAESTSRQTGQVPASYQQGSGTIVSGTAANKATEAALAAYPGGVVDRVVQLSNGEYEVHYIGVNWPHHVFVSQDFQVAGAE
jgi:membrane-bound inhibitor of C-type lysozyme